MAKVKTRHRQKPRVRGKGLLGDLNPRQIAFVENYIRDGNATRSALAAGYSKRSAHAQGHDLLKKAEIRAAIEASKARAAKRMDLTQERVLRHLGSQSFYDVTDVVSWNSEGKATLKPSTAIPEALRAAIKGFRVNPDGTVGLEFVDKHQATVSLGKFLGMSTREQLEVAGRGGAPIEITDPEANRARLSDRDLARRLAFILTSERERVRQAHVIEGPGDEEPTR